MLLNVAVAITIEATQLTIDTNADVTALTISCIIVIYIIFYIPQNKIFLYRKRLFIYRNMNKLNEEESRELYDFLHHLKKLNWIIDSHINFMDISHIFEWHFKITGLIQPHDNIRDKEERLGAMTKDLTDYFKKDIIIIEKIRCKNCRRNKPKDSFFGRKICRSCQKKI